MNGHLLVIVILVPLVLGFGVGASCTYDLHKASRLLIENDFCAKGDRRGGGRLLRGQDKSYVCVDPRAVKWERR